jgi:hypothetical protein
MWISIGTRSWLLQTLHWHFATEAGTIAAMAFASLVVAHMVRK